MAPKSRGTTVLFDLLFKPYNTNHICVSCRNNVSRARYASTATAQATVESPAISNISPDESGASPLSQPRIVIKAGVVVSRPPLITPDPHPFDTAFHLYQRRLNERLVLPFSQYFHYKRGTPAFEQWRTNRRERGGVAARDLGEYNAYTKESWNDEVLMNDDAAQPEKVVEQLVEEEGRGAEFVGEGNESNAKLAGLKRATEADEKKDQTSLERQLTRTLYLLVRSNATSKGAPAAKSWRFPSGNMEQKEALKEAAQRVLGSSCGPNMNTWLVASHPIGHCVEDQATEKTFFMKARILAGQADVKDNIYGVEEFRWLGKEEVKEHVTEEYWNSIKNMLVEQ